jgi:hypothetical protein
VDLVGVRADPEYAVVSVSDEVFEEFPGSRDVRPRIFYPMGFSLTKLGGRTIGSTSDSGWIADGAASCFQRLRVGENVLCSF